MEREYKGWCIEVRSYSSGRQWRPSVIVSTKTGGCLQIATLKTPSDRLLDTKHESDEHGYQLGSAWIDRNE